MRRAAWMLAVAMALAPMGASAQFWEKLSNPQVRLPIRHPPSLGLQVSKVAFGPARGPGSDELIDMLTQAFVAANVEVVERDQLQALLREHNFSMSGYVDATSAAAMGKIVGPAVLIFVETQRYTTEQKRLHDDWKDGKGVMHRTYISRTDALIRGSIRSVDLATSRVFAAQVFEATPRLENKINDSCCAEFPGEEQVLGLARGAVVGQMHRLFLPWTEVTDLYFYDDKDCNLKAAFGLMKAGDVDGALGQSKTNLEACKELEATKPKTVAHAYHNVGMVHFASGDFEGALKYLTEAQRVRPGDIHVKAIADCNRALDLTRQAQRIEERMAVAEASTTAARKADEEAAAAATLTNTDVLDMAKAKLPDSIILTKVKASKCKFDLTTKALISLKAAGVSEAVLVAMMEKQ